MSLKNWAVNTFLQSKNKKEFKYGGALKIKMIAC